MQGIFFIISVYICNTTLIMPKPYNQWRAMLAISKASLTAMFRSPSTVVFSFAFPMIFILVFGFLGNGGGSPVYKIVLDKTGDTSNVIVDSLRRYKNIKFITDKTDEEIRTDLVKGRLTGIMKISKLPSHDSTAHYLVTFNSTTASGDKLGTFLPFMENVINKIDRSVFRDHQTVARIVPVIESVREYKTIDFILPGQLGFSLLSAGVFGVAFLFFNLRNQLVLKRFYATPISRTHIVLGEGFARVIFQMITAVVILAIGHFAFGFTFANGISTFLELLVLSFIGLVIFMGFGFIVSSLAKNESAIPPFANLITLPQFLLAGTFFSIDNFPKWLQPFCNILPLTHMNDAMRKVAFEGAHLTDCGKQLGILGLWGVVVYAVAIKVFKWE